MAPHPQPSETHSDTLPIFVWRRSSRDPLRVLERNRLPQRETGQLQPRCVYPSCGPCSINGAIHFVCMDWRHIKEVIIAGEGIYNELKNLCIWNKPNAG